MNPSEHDHASEDAALLTQVTAGNLDAPLAQLYQRYARELYVLGLRRLRDHGLAEELVQETFIRLWRRAGRFNPDRGRVSDYLFTIPNTTVVDLQRQAAARAHPSAPDPDTAPQDVPPDQAEAMATALRQAGVACTYRRLEGEGHGFKQPATIRTALEAELEFYQQVLGLPEA